MRSKRRIRWLSYILILLLVVILVRLFFIQCVSTRAFSREKVDLIKLAQNMQNEDLVIQSGRGMILDRFGRPLVGETKWRVLVFPHTKAQIDSLGKSFEQLADLLGYSPDWLAEQLCQIRHPRMLTGPTGTDPVVTQEQKKRIEALNIPGIFVVSSDNRTNPRGQQVIGYVARNPLLAKERYEGTEGASLQTRVGITGLEASMDPFLRGKLEDILVYTKDRRGRPLNGIEVETKEQGQSLANVTPKTVVSTLDQEIQQRVEQILLEEGVKEGAVVVQEIATGNILALASSPRGKAVNGKNPWDNRAVTEATPGSIFKIVVAIAALEEGIVRPDTKFHCQGYLNRWGLHDAKKGGHGHITFKEAFAQSCNVVFGQVAEKVGGQRLEAYAKRLGLGQRIIWSGSVLQHQQFRQLLGENTGLVFSAATSKKDLGAVAQTGLGQRDVKMTPIQAANMVTALFHLGRAISPRLVTEIREPNGKVVYQFRNQYLSHSKPLKASTLKALKSMMRLVVKEGTASSLAHASLELSGKTGTAQLGGKKPLYNRWMIGFGPSHFPRYSVAVSLYSVPDSVDPRSTRIFLRVQKEIMNYEKQRTKEQIKEKHSKATKEKSKPQKVR